MGGSPRVPIARILQQFALRCVGFHLLPKKASGFGILKNAQNPSIPQRARIASKITTQVNKCSTARRFQTVLRVQLRIKRNRLKQQTSNRSSSMATGFDCGHWPVHGLSMQLQSHHFQVWGADRTATGQGTNMFNMMLGINKNSEANLKIKPFQKERPSFRPCHAMNPPLTPTSRNRGRSEGGVGASSAPWGPRRSPRGAHPAGAQSRSFSGPVTGRLDRSVGTDVRLAPEVYDTHLGGWKNLRDTLRIFKISLLHEVEAPVPLGSFARLACFEIGRAHV